MHAAARPPAPADDAAALAQLCREAVAQCRAAGANEASASSHLRRSLAVGVRHGEVETLTRRLDRQLVVRAQVGRSLGVASTADFDPGSVRQTVAKACAIARLAEPDVFNGLPDPTLYPTEAPELDLWHPWALEVDEAVELARGIEAAGREEEGITNSDGAEVESGSVLRGYANSHGFVGRRRESWHELSCSLLAGHGEGMQRGSWYDIARAPGDLELPGRIGRLAAERALARLGARGLGTRQCPVLFVPELARGLLGHFVAAVEGKALYNGATLYADHLGKRLFPAFVRLVEHPHLARGMASAVFDEEGVATQGSLLVDGGVLQRYVLDSYAARKLGLRSTGNAGGVRNLLLEPGMHGFQALLREMGTGLVVTQLMGQGVSPVSGNYSRGASGFWVEGGEIAYPVEGITIASNLREMFLGIAAVGNDVDRRGAIASGSILVERMTVAGT
ncbi:metallopeptidase TldD-related protein [Frateuria defendens]|uniref:metallopeptidase TldD-related protein n=1 Tax=Frateuria defendens TaxID=2219559 RepID=UPI00066FF984